MHACMHGWLSGVAADMYVCVYVWPPASGMQAGCGGGVGSGWRGEGGNVGYACVKDDFFGALQVFVCRDAGIVCVVKKKTCVHFFQSAPFHFP